MTQLTPAQNNPWLTRSVLRDLRVSCDSATQVTIRQGAVVGSDDGAVVMELSSDVTVDITTSGVNGLDTGSEAVSTWYYVYLIWNESNGQIDGLLSASSTSPAMPSGYTKKRLVSAVRNNSSGNFMAFVQQGNKIVLYSGNGFAIYTGTPSANTWYSLSPVVPHKAYAIGVFSGASAPSSQDVNIHAVADVKSGSVGAGDSYVTLSHNEQATDPVLPGETMLNANRQFSFYITSSVSCWLYNYIIWMKL